MHELDGDGDYVACERWPDSVLLAEEAAGQGVRQECSITTIGSGLQESKS